MSDFTYPQISVTATNPSVGPNGSTAPTSSTEIGFIDGSGNLQGVSATEPLPTTVTSSSLPTGAATAANQVTQETTLTAIQANQTNGTQHTIVDSSALPTGAATAANQTNGTQVTQISGTVPLPSGAATAALQSNVQSAPGTPQTTAVTVQGNASGIAVPISAAALPLPPNASTAANQASEIGLLTTISGNTPTPTLFASGTASSATTIIASTDVSVFSGVSIQFTGTWSGTILVQGSNDGTNFVSLPCFLASNISATPNFSVVANGLFYFSVKYRYIQVVVSAYTSGTVVATLVAQAVGLFEATASMVNQGTAGSVSASWFTKVSDGTNTAAVKAASTAPAATDPSLVVAISPNSTTPKSSGRALANAPTILQYSATNVTTGAYVTLIASTTSAANLVEVFDSSGQALDFAVGAAASEVNQFLIYPGGNGQVSLAIPASSRISLKSATATASSGYIIVNLYT